MRRGSFLPSVGALFFCQACLVPGYDKVTGHAGEAGLAGNGGGDAEPGRGTGGRAGAGGSEPEAGTAGNAGDAGSVGVGGTSSPPVGEMVTLPAGTFFLGSNEGRANELPVLEVAVPEFELDVTEVTTVAYFACVSGGECALPPGEAGCNTLADGEGDHPINCVSALEAERYCETLGKRLPTEVEWEYAARGAAGRTYPWGESEPTSQLCWSGGTTSQGRTCVVGRFRGGATPEGVVDMAGNVWEWTSSPYTESHGAEPLGTGRVIRGAGFANLTATSVRAALRAEQEPDSRNNTVGFRCARGGS